jgi:hypothetical protein
MRKGTVAKTRNLTTGREVHGFKRAVIETPNGNGFNRLFDSDICVTAKIPNERSLVETNHEIATDFEKWISDVNRDALNARRDQRAGIKLTKASGQRNRSK